MIIKKISNIELIERLNKSSEALRSLAFRHGAYITTHIESRDNTDYFQHFVNEHGIFISLGVDSNSSVKNFGKCDS